MTDPSSRMNSYHIHHHPRTRVVVVGMISLREGVAGVALRTRRRQRRRQDMDSADGKSKRIYTDIFWWGEGRDFILAQKNSTTRQAN